MNSDHRLDRIHALNLEFAAVEEKLISEIASLRDQGETASAKLEAVLQQAAQDAGEQNRLREEIRQAGRELQALNQKLQALQEQHVQLQQELATREQAILEQATQAKQAKQDVENLLRAQVQREEAVAEKLEVVRSQTKQESTELARTLAEQQHALHSQYKAREQALGQQLESEKQERSKREQTLLEQTSQAKQEVENLLRTQAQREREVLAQLLAVQQQAIREKVELTRSHAEKTREIGSQAAQREKSLTQQLHAHQQELRNLQKECVKREQEAAQEKADFARRHSEQEHVLLRQQADCEKTHSLQLLTQQDEFRNLHVAHLKREQELLAEHSQIRQQQNGLHDALVQREQEALAQLQAAQKQAAQEIVELLHKQSEQEHALHRQHSQREETFTQQLQELQQLLQHQKEDWALVEQALNNQIALLHSKTQVLHQTQQSQAQQHGLELSTRLDERTSLLQACAALEAQLKAEMQTGQQTSEHLRQLLKEAQHSLEMTHTSLSWGITAPLRKLVRLFTSNKNQTLAPISFSTPVKPELGMQVATAPPPIIVNQALLKPLMPPLTQATSPIMPTIASTLAELLACHDQQFVICAYQTLLGRAPDSEGQGYYLGRLRTGFSKIQILAQLRLSDEGKTYAANLPGLDTAIERYQKGQYPLIGWLFRRLNGWESNQPIERKLRGIENQLLLLSDESNRRLNQIETALTGLHNLMVQQAQSIVVDLGGAPTNSLDLATAIPVQLKAPDKLKQLSPRARDIYFQLKTAAAIHAGGIA